MIKDFQDLDAEFLKRAQRITSFNLATADFESIRYKKEIQFLFKTHLFPDFDLKKIQKGLNKRRVNSFVSELKQQSYSSFNALFGYNLKLVGPGEVMLYFLIDDAYLGGGSSSGQDLVFLNGRGHEVKAAAITNDGWARDFKLGSTVGLGDIQEDLNDLRDKLGLPGSRSAINQTVIRKMRDLAPVEFQKIEFKYSERAYGYFDSHEVIFLNNNKGRAVRGNIQSVQHVDRHDILIDVLTQNTIKPRIKIR